MALRHVCYMMNRAHCTSRYISFLVWYRTSIVMKIKTKSMVFFFFSCCWFATRNMDSGATSWVGKRPHRYRGERSVCFFYVQPIYCNFYFCLSVTAVINISSLLLVFQVNINSVSTSSSEVHVEEECLKTNKSTYFFSENFVFERVKQRNNATSTSTRT